MIVSLSFSAPNKKKVPKKEKKVLISYFRRIKNKKCVKFFSLFSKQKKYEKSFQETLNVHAESKKMHLYKEKK